MTDNNEKYKAALDTFPIIPITKKELVKVCRRINEKSVHSLNNIPNKTRKLGVKTRSDWNRGVFEIPVLQESLGGIAR